jgi:hypothetical protein
MGNLIFIKPHDARSRARWVAVSERVEMERAVGASREDGSGPASWRDALHQNTNEATKRNMRV